ncbi:hypothetical protein LBMAG53_39100 [Planctomycetota bacterium]|nr:hypothetical protein LBMAG53_39100 [Planctomycetota bacterium]
MRIAMDTCSLEHIIYGHSSCVMADLKSLIGCGHTFVLADHTLMEIATHHKEGRYNEPARKALNEYFDMLDENGPVLSGGYDIPNKIAAKIHGVPYRHEYYRAALSQLIRFINDMPPQDIHYTTDSGTFKVEPLSVATRSIMDQVNHNWDSTLLGKAKSTPIVDQKRDISNDYSHLVKDFGDRLDLAIRYRYEVENDKHYHPGSNSKKNDGIDYSMLLYLAHDDVYVTSDDVKFVKRVKSIGSPQGARIGHLDEMRAALAC